MARVTAKEIGEALDLENQIEHDLFVDESEREAWQDYQDGLGCDDLLSEPDWPDWFDDGGPDYYDPYPPCDDDFLCHTGYGW